MFSFERLVHDTDVPNEEQIFWHVLDFDLLLTQVVLLFKQRWYGKSNSQAMLESLFATPQGVSCDL